MRTISFIYNLHLWVYIHSGRVQLPGFRKNEDDWRHERGHERGHEERGRSHWPVVGRRDYSSIKDHTPIHYPITLFCDIVSKRGRPDSLESLEKRWIFLSEKVSRDIFCDTENLLKGAATCIREEMEETVVLVDHRCKAIPMQTMSPMVDPWASSHSKDMHRR